MMAQQITSDTRPSPIAGQWYPGNANDLATMIDGFLAVAPDTPIPGQIVGLVAPHAGYVYSGRIAAHAFRLVKGMSFDRVVVVSPMHQIYYDSVLTTAHQAYGTPLGAIQVDHQALALLRQKLPIEAVRKDPEHSLEIELPFLQRTLEGSFSLIPLMLRDQSYRVANTLGKALAQAINELGITPLLVASSDLSHFYTQNEAKQLDQTMLDAIEAFDPQAVIQSEDEGRAFACGRAAIATVLVAAKALGADRVQITGYGTSADASGDTHRVVGYGAAAIYKSDVGS
jgi:AmmeMemoRadiSam system protein B